MKMKHLTGRATAAELSEVGGRRNYANWKRHLLMIVYFRRVVFIMGSWKGCPRLRNEYWFGLNGGRIWYKEWFGLLAMALKSPASAVTANCSTVAYRRDRRAATDALCGTNHLYDGRLFIVRSSVLRWNIQQWVQTTRYRRSVIWWSATIGGCRA